MVLTIAAFVLALSLLIAIHEYGHYRMAVACGVKVLRFSIGFGPVLLRWTSQKSGTEFALSALPLGGYVKMLDEREAPVATQERHRAFNVQPLRSRVLIVAAGPLANLGLAVLLYAVLNWGGVQMAVPVLGMPVPGSIAEQAGVVGGERVSRAGFDAPDLAPDDLQSVRSFEDLTWLLSQAALAGRDVRLLLDDGTQLRLGLAQLNAREVDADLFERIGLMAPLSKPEIGDVLPEGAAQAAGLRTGDLVLSVDDLPVRDSRQLRELIRASAPDGVAQVQRWRVDRAGQFLVLEVRPDVVVQPVGGAEQRQAGRTVGRIGAYIGAQPEMLTVRYGPLEGLWQGVVKTWDVSAMTLKTLGRMVIGEASLKNLSGPLTIADYAGRSASLGLSAYLLFLALISVSLGVLNLLPLPLLDGGHLMYYLWEGLTGRPVSEAGQARLQRVGVFVLVLMMSIALVNDVTRLFG
ncbi:zinc metalloprotease [Hylemonella gracilis str. Niagara R]|uniref:Zinc metalloprotease n=1 Tax=Hylemonella gracilis str. Niagara R TaxID=1458275 RepID=A0A016XGJ7_9BURK|nr:RIP metalloprotease RseP [Hylemonella gracilis]EYC51010.1 zinc metalloprotease [Hylemonella gracilis str. Niagara R]